MMKNLLQSCGYVALLILSSDSFAQDATELVGKKVIVVASDVTLTSGQTGIRRAQYGDVATVKKVDGQKVWLEENGGWIQGDQIIPAEGAVQTWNKRFSDMQDKTEYDADVALKFAAALSAYNQMTGVKQVASQIIQHDPSVAEAFRLRGLCFMLDSKFPEGLADFDRACALKPKSADLRVNRAICQVGVGQFDAAIEQLSAVLTDEADHIDAIYQRGTVYKLQDQHDAALRDYGRVLTLSPQHVKALRKRADVYRTLAEFDRAAADAQMWTKTDPEDGRSFILLGDIYRDANEPEKAIAVYSQAMELKPYRPNAWSGRGLARLMIGLHDEAAEDFRQALQLYPHHVPSLVELGHMSLADGDDLQRALSYFEQARTEEPQNAQVHAGIGDVFLALDQLDEAINAYTSALKIAPDFAGVLTNRGVAYEYRGQLLEAIADYSRAIELDPEDPLVWLNRGNGYTQEGQYDRAIADYTRGIALDPNNTDMYAGRASALTGSGDRASLKAAVADGDQAIALAPEDFYAYTARGYAKQELGDLDGATSDFRRATNLGGPEGEAHRLLGYVLYLDGDFKAALEELTTAITLNSEDAEARRLRGIVHRDNGNYELSLEDLLDANALTPENAEILMETAYTYDEMWRFDDALDATDCALQIAPDDVRALNYRAYILGCGPTHLWQPEQALKDALKANKLTGGENAAVLDTLACVYASNDDFQNAEATGKLAIAKAADSQSVLEDATAHLELFRQKQVFRLPEDRPVELETGPPVDAVAAIDGAVDSSYVPAECFAALLIRPSDILSSPHLKSIPTEILMEPLLSEFGMDIRLVEEVLIPMFPSRDLPPAFLIRVSKPVGPGRAAAHPALVVNGWKECEYSGRPCFTKRGRVTCFIDGYTVITGPRAAVKRMLATNDTPSLLRNSLRQTKNDAAMLLQVELSVCPNFIASATEQQANKIESAAFARFMPDARSFTARLTSAEHVVLTGTADMNSGVAASRLNLSLNEALQSLRNSLTDVTDDFLPVPAVMAKDMKAIVSGLLANTTLSTSGPMATMEVRTDGDIEGTLLKLGQLLNSE